LLRHKALQIGSVSIFGRASRNGFAQICSVDPPSTVGVTLFASLKPYDFLAEGAAAHVYVINRAVVLKVPIRYSNPDPIDITDYAAGHESLEHEKAIYEVLNERKFKHPNLLRCILAIPEGIFLERLATTLEFRNRNREKEPVSESTVTRS
jgi:hypothetical protein